MNENERNQNTPPINEGISENQEISAKDAAASITPSPSPAPAAAPAAFHEDTPSDDSAASDGSYHLSGDQIPKADGYMPPSSEAFSGADFNTADADAANPPRSEYEVSYDSVSGRYTYTYTDSNNTAPQKKKKGKLGIVFLSIGGGILLLVLSVLMGVLGGAIGATARGESTTVNPNLNVPVVTQTVVNVNNAEVGETSVMQAAATAVNSVVVIDTFTSQSAAEAGEQSGSGSGVIWTADGYIATCNHVIDGFSVIRVTLADGRSFFADVVGTDARTDLAVLKIAASELPSVAVRGTDLILGETVVAIGNPLGVLSNTVSSGILSCLTREITVEGQTMSLIQIDAAVNHGNSGGGLFDTNGSLIGIVNAKSTGDSVEGIGFAIPITTVLEVCNQLIEVGYVSGRPQLGVTVVAVTQANSSYIFDDEYYPKLKDYATSTYRDIWGHERSQVIPGVYIYDTSLVAGYASGSDQLEFGDRILFVGSTEISGTSDVLTALSAYSAGDTIQLTVQRDHSTTIIVNVILGQQGAN